MPKSAMCYGHYGHVKKKKEEEEQINVQHHDIFIIQLIFPG